MSLWLVPEGEAAETLGGLVDTLAREHGTPRFHPHVTLLGGVGDDDWVLHRAQVLAMTCGPFDLTLNRVVHRDEFYRAVVIEAAPSIDLLRLHHLAREACDKLEDPALFEPHLSLMYGELPEALRRDVVARLGRMRVTFRVDTLSVWSTEGDPPDWQEVERFHLTEL